MYSFFNMEFMIIFLLSGNYFPRRNDADAAIAECVGKNDQPQPHKDTIYVTLPLKLKMKKTKCS